MESASDSRLRFPDFKPHSSWGRQYQLLFILFGIVFCTCEVNHDTGFISHYPYALWPGGIIAVSPGPPSTADPSSITTFIRPEIIYDGWGSWQLFVFTIGFTHMSQLQPSSNVPLPIAIPLSWKFTISIFPFSKVLVSSAEEPKLVACNLVDDIFLIILSPIFKKPTAYLISVFGLF